MKVSPSLVKHKPFRNGSTFLSMGLALVTTVGVMLPATSQATLLFDQNVTPDVIFGTGNPNGFFTVDRNNGVELGLRAKIPFVGAINSNGDGSYSYTILQATPRWNFDWTVNTDWDGSTEYTLLDLTYELLFDYDPSLGVNFLGGDPIHVTNLQAAALGHSIGDNNTLNGGGEEPTGSNPYSDLIQGKNVLQNSSSPSFGQGFPGVPFYDPAIDGTYDVMLSAFGPQQGLLASTRIQVIIGRGGQVPEPATLLLLALGLAGLRLSRGRFAG